MRCWLAVVVTAVALTVVACGGGNSPASSGSPTSVATGAGLSTPGFRGTPSNFSEARDAVRSRLDAIGVNIGEVPQDVRRQVLAQCRDMTRFADQKKVTDLCGAVERAMNTGDFGLLDQVIAQLDQLKKK